MLKKRTIHKYLSLLFFFFGLGLSEIELAKHQIAQANMSESNVESGTCSRGNSV